MDESNVSVKKPEWQIARHQRKDARRLRRDQTEAERLIWFELRNHRLQGASFRRQVPIGPFIADFVCHAAGLVIEIDGGQHFSDDGEKSDRDRTAFIESRGYRVLRFSNRDVMTNKIGVLQTIADIL